MAFDHWLNQILLDKTFQNSRIETIQPINISQAHCNECFWRDSANKIIYLINVSSNKKAIIISSVSSQNAFNHSKNCLEILLYNVCQ